jgi:hypothetical protein
MTNAEELANLEERYKRIAEDLPEEEQMALLDTESSSYGHDLLAAIGRGWRRRSAIAISQAMNCEGMASTYGRETESKVRFLFAMTLTRLISVAGAAGVTAEEVRWQLQRELDCDDATSIERKVNP